MNRKKAESGQALILVAIGFISLLGFAGLAIDGGRVFSERRNIQNVADTAAFTGAMKIGRTYIGDIGTDPSALKSAAAAAAQDRAKKNGYDVTDLTLPPGWVEVNVDVYHEGTPGTVDDPNPYYKRGSPFYVVEVEIVSHIDPTFIQLVYRGDLTATANAVARVHPKMPVGYGFSVVALADKACNAIDVSSSSDVTIKGSGIFSNSDASECSPPGCPKGAITIGGGGNVTVDNGISAPGGVCPYGAGTISTGEEGIDETAPQIVILPIPEPVCPPRLPGEPQRDTLDPKEKYFNAGSHTDIILYPNVTYTFKTGMHCIYGYIHIQPGSIVKGDGVMFVMINGEFGATGGVLDLHAGPSTSGVHVEDLDGNNWDGMLIYMPWNDKTSVNDSSVEINPEEGSDMSGTVYAPGKPKTEPKCFFTGNGEVSGHNLQWLCYTITLRGDSSFDIAYDESKIYFPPVALDLVE